MKKLMLSVWALAAWGSVAFAGTETYTKESSVVPPCPQWYADNELNLSLSGVYAFTGSDWREDTYYGVDHAWGGAFDAKYFMHRYFGFGVQGFVTSANTHDIGDSGVVRFRFSDDDDNQHAVGGILGTLTVRFPISCSRFAPYLWVGGGGIWGGGRNSDFFIDPNLGVVRREFDESEGKAVGQFGGGFEVRLTPNFGLLNDFSWNVISGSNNNFGMARTGLNFAF